MSIFREALDGAENVKRELWKKEREMVLRYMAEFNQDLYDGKGVLFERETGVSLRAMLVDIPSMGGRLSRGLQEILSCSTTAREKLSVDLTLIASEGKATVERSVFDREVFPSEDQLVACLRKASFEAIESREKAKIMMLW